MPRNPLPALILLLLPVLATPAAARAAEPALKKNPFQRPLRGRVGNPRPAAAAGKPGKASPGAPALRVTAILISDSRPMALVNGRMLSLGESLHGARLVGVEEQAALFEYRGRRLRYRLRSNAPAPTTPNL